MSKNMVCRHCEVEFKLYSGKPGKIDECGDCAEEVVQKYTGNMIYDHKVGAQIQINSDPRLTEYINKSTKLKNKGSNLGSNLKVDSNMQKSNGCVHDAGGRSRRRE